MKKSEIVLDGTYGNGKGRIRKVIEFGPFVLYSGQTDLDCVKYEIVDDGTKKNKTKGTRSCMTRAAFAAWAKDKLDDKEDNE